MTNSNEPVKYLSVKSLAAYLDVSEQTARSIVNGVMADVGPGRRYSSPYVVVGAGRTTRVAAAAAVDFFKYGEQIKDPTARAALPPFDIAKAEREIGIRASSAAIDLDYQTMAAAIVRQMRLTPLLG